MQPIYQEILDFWIDETGPEGWYRQDDALDAEIAARFGKCWQSARAGAFSGWMRCAEGALALLILTDQFPRNMFRGSAEAFATDRRALGVANQSIARGFDLATPEPQRQFFYLPFMHAESLPHQERGVRLFLMNMPGGENLLHARAHRKVIRDFGRFPYRNDALGRHSTVAETDYLSAGAYGATVRSLQGDAA